MKMADGGFRPAYNVQFSADCRQPGDRGRGGADHGQRHGPTDSDGRANSRALRHGRRGDVGRWRLRGAPGHRGGRAGRTAPRCMRRCPSPKTPVRTVMRRMPGDSETVAAWRARMGTEAGQGDLQGPRRDGGVRQRAGAEPGAGAFAGAWVAEGEGDRVVVSRSPTTWLCGVRLRRGGPGGLKRRNRQACRGQPRGAQGQAERGGHHSHPHRSSDLALPLTTSEILICTFRNAPIICFTTSQ